MGAGFCGAVFLWQVYLCYNCKAWIIKKFEEKSLQILTDMNSVLSTTLVSIQ